MFFTTETEKKFSLIKYIIYNINKIKRKTLTRDMRP